MSVKQSADDPVYHIKSGDRVRVLIFNHEFYDNDPKGTKRRKTTDEHRDDLKKTLEKFEFKVECFDDLTLTEIKNEMKKGFIYLISKFIKLFDFKSQMYSSKG